jgi:hypothetical protein
MTIGKKPRTKNLCICFLLLSSRVEFAGTATQTALQANSNAAEKFARQFDVTAMTQEQWHRFADTARHGAGRNARAARYENSFALGGEFHAVIDIRHARNKA